MEIAERDRQKESSRLEILRQHFVTEIGKNLPEAIVNGPVQNVLPSIASVSVPGVLSEMLLLALDRDGVMVSAGSACSSNSQESGSYVLRAIGKAELAESTLRFSFGRTTTKKDLEHALEVLYRRVRCGKMSS
jgi:cysteine desulfurase